MKIRLATNKDKKQIYETMGYCFNTPRQAILNNIENGNLESERMIVATDDNDDVKSLVSIVPFKVNFEGKVVGFGGAAGVSSLPENRGEGNIANLFTFALTYMKEHNMILSGLGPFAFQYYRKFGYEWCYTWQLVTIGIDDLKSFKPAPKYKRFFKEDASIVEEFRNRITSKMNGPIVRDEKIIEDKWNHYFASNSYVYGALNENDELVSYMVYKQEGREIKVSEMYFTNETSRQYLLNFLYRHRSMTDKVELVLTVDDEIRNIIPTPRINYWNWPNKMGRVVMVKEALELMNIEDEFNDPFTIKVNDAQADWNNKTFKISCKNHSLIVEESTDTADFEVSIQRLSQLILGHISGKQALDFEFLTVNNSAKEPLIKKTFTKRTTMLWQEF